jgi:hypothetical protein
MERSEHTGFGHTAPGVAPANAGDEKLKYQK